MSLSVKTTRLDGDVSVGRNISAGGKVEIAGSVNVGHNVLVGGWLDAPNIKGPLKGLFATEAALKAAYPHPRPGWVAYAGDNVPAAIYMAVGGKWKATGKHGGEPSLSADSLYDIVEGVRQDVLGLEANVAENREGLSDARAALDTLRTDTDSLRQETTSLGGRLGDVEETVRKNIGRSVDVTELDTRFTADADTVLDVARGELSGSWNVTIKNGSNVRTVGVLHVWADDALHTVTQEFTTNALLNKSGNFECVHDHGVHCYTRYYTVKYADTLPDGSVLPAKTWSGWTDRDSALDRLRQEMEERADSLDERLSDIEFNIGAGHSYESLLARLVRLEKGLEDITRLLTLS